MTFVIAEPRVDQMDRACIAVCPVDCIRNEPDDRKLYIDPDECIECGSCVAECAQTAIFHADDLPRAWAAYEAIDATWFRDGERARAMLERELTLVPG